MFLLSHEVMDHEIDKQFAKKKLQNIQLVAYNEQTASHSKIICRNSLHTRCTV